MNKFLENNCGRCEHYIENFEFNILPGRCSVFDKFVGRFEVKPCFSEHKHSSIKVSNNTGLVPIDTKPVKEYMIVMDNPDDYKIIYEYIRKQLKDVIQILDLSEVNEVKL